MGWHGGSHGSVPDARQPRIERTALPSLLSAAFIERFFVLAIDAIPLDDLPGHRLDELRRTTVVSLFHRSASDSHLSGDFTENTSVQTTFQVHFRHDFIKDSIGFSVRLGANKRLTNSPQKHNRTPFPPSGDLYKAKIRFDRKQIKYPRQIKHLWTKNYPL